MNITAMTHNRKRSRNLREDDTSDFMPLSKRINNLHINNVFQVIPNSSQTSNQLVKPTEWGPGPPEQFPEASREAFHSPPTPDTPQYSPELDETQNPYYYNNKLLFDLFVERMQRNGHSFH